MLDSMRAKRVSKFMAFTVVCKSNESVIQLNAQIIIILKSVKKIQWNFSLPIVLVNVNFWAAIHIYR